MGIVEMMTEQVDDFMLDVSNENCTECKKPLVDSDIVSGLLGEDEMGLPGFALFHDYCLANRLLRLL